MPLVAAHHGVSYHHEDMSLRMIEYMVDENQIELEKDDLRFVQQIIVGAKERHMGKRDSRGYLYEIVANGRNCIDVDKFDYLARDMINLFGVRKGFNFTRLWLFNRVIDDQICYHTSVNLDIYDLFQQRYQMHKSVRPTRCVCVDESLALVACGTHALSARVCRTVVEQIYNHRKGKAVEFMICDAMLLAGASCAVSYISVVIRSPLTHARIYAPVQTRSSGSPQRPNLLPSSSSSRTTSYMYDRADPIIGTHHYRHTHTVRMCLLSHTQTIEASKDPDLAEARRIIKQLRCRKLYEFVDEYLLPPEVMSKVPKVTSETIACCNVTSGVTLDPHDIIVADGRLNYNLEDRNPVDNVSFYSSNDLNHSFHIPKDQVSLLFPEKVRRAAALGGSRRICERRAERTD